MASLIVIDFDKTLTLDAGGLLASQGNFIALAKDVETSELEDTRIGSDSGMEMKCFRMSSCPDVRGSQ